MRLPRVRFTVRRLMVAVAVAAIALGWQRRWAYCREMAEHHHIRSYCCVKSPDKDVNERMERRAGYHARMERKYRIAAWLFLLPIPPDPPEPE